MLLVSVWFIFGRVTVTEHSSIFWQTCIVTVLQNIASSENLWTPPWKKKITLKNTTFKNKIIYSCWFTYCCSEKKKRLIQFPSVFTLNLVNKKKNVIESRLALKKENKDQKKQLKESLVSSVVESKKW